MPWAATKRFHLQQGFTIAVLIILARLNLMFTRVQALRFRCLRSIDQKLGRFATLVGPNASGKTTFLDVIALLGDLMRNGGKVADTVLERSPDFDKLLWMGQGASFQLALEATLPSAVRSQMADDKGRFSTVRYEIEIGMDREANQIVLNHEALWLLEDTEKTPPIQRQLFPYSADPPDTLILPNAKTRKKIISNQPGGNANYYADGRSHDSDGKKRKIFNPSFRLGRQSSALANIPADRDSFHAAPWFRDLLLENIQGLALNSQKIRYPSPPGLGRRFQFDGSNLPWVIAELERDKSRFQHWLDHIKTALPDITNIVVIERPEDRHRYLVIQYEGGAEVPSWLASDGTLRLLALTVTAYLPDFNGVFLIEEPENGIHPRAIETVLESLSSIYEGQVLLATHSPVALNMLDPADVLCFAKSSNGATDIVSGDQHPALQDWKRGQPDFGVLFASGILS